MSRKTNDMFSLDSCRVSVITPTTGVHLLRQCVESVLAQSWGRVQHVVVVDGKHHLEKVKDVLAGFLDDVTLFILPEPTGENHFYGHRVYGALPFLVNADFVSYLDEDNWFETDHIEKLITLCQVNNLDWAYALRRIMNHEGEFICNDNCESLGIWGAWCNGQNMVDTSCYLLRREVAIEAAHIWYRQGYSTTECDPDKALCRWLMANKIKGFTSGEYTVNYRLGSSDSSAVKEYFLDGNALMSKMYHYFPWSKPELEVIHESIDYRRVYTQCEKQHFSPLKWSGRNMVAGQRGTP